MSAKDLVYNLILNAKNFVSGAHEATEAVGGVGKHGEESLTKLDKLIESSKEKFGELGKTALGVFGGGAALASAAGIGEAFKSVWEEGEQVLKNRNKLREAFGNDKDTKAAEEGAERLAAKYNVEDDTLKDLAATAKITGGATGKFNENIVELSVGLDKLKIPGISADAVMKGFLLGAGDPEGQEGLGRLNRAFPQLASGLAGITDPAEKTKKALEIMSPVLEQVAADAQGPGEASERMRLELKNLQEDIGEKVVPVIAGTFIPVLEFLIKTIDGVVQIFDDVPGPVTIILKVVGALTGVVIAATVAEKLHIVSKIASFIQTGKDIVLRGIDIVGRIAHTVVTWAQVAATWALNAGLVALTSPVTLVIAGIVLLAAGVVYAYNHFGFFKNFVDGLWAGLKQLWTEVIAGVKWIGNLAKSVIDAVGPLKALVDVGGKVVSWLGDLFSAQQKLSPEQEKMVKQIEAETAALEAQTKARAAMVKGIEDQDALEKDNVDQGTKYVNAINQTINAIETRGRATLKGVEYTAKDIEMLTKLRDQGIANAKTWIDDVRAQETANDETQEQLYGKTEETAKKVKDVTKKSIADRYAIEKEDVEARFKLMESQTEREMTERGESAEKIKMALLSLEEDKNEALTDVNQRFHTESLTLTTAGLAKRLKAQGKTADEIKDTVTQENNKIIKLQEKFQLALADTTLAGVKTRAEINKTDQDQQEKDANEKQANAISRYKQSEEDQSEAVKGIREQRDADLESMQLSSFEREIQANRNHVSDLLQDNQQLYDKGVISEEQYQAKKNKIVADFAEKQRQLEEEEIKKSSVAWAGFTSGLQSLFQQMTKTIETVLGGLFGFEKTMSENEVKLSQQTRDKKIRDITDEVRTNKLSYQDYVTDKQAAEDEYTKKVKANQFDLAATMRSVEKSITDSVVGELMKRFEQWLADQALRLATSIIYGTSNVAAGTALAATLGAAWAPAAAMASVASFGGADIAATAGLTATVAAAQLLAIPKADKGIFVDDVRSGGKLIQIGEKRPEFAAAEQDFASYSEKRLTPMLEQVFSRNLMRSPSGLRTFQNLQKGLPQLHPGISRQATNNLRQDNEHIQRLNGLLDHIAKNGIHSYVGEEDFKRSILRNNRSVSDAVRLRGQKVATRGQATGGGMTAR